MPEVGCPTKLKTVCAFLKNGTCSKTLMTVLDRQLDHPLELEERATDPFAGGMMQGYQCGMLWGSTLAAGALAHRAHGPGEQAEAAAMRAARRLIEAFRARHEHINCLEITETDPQDKWQTLVYFFLKGGTIRCAARMAGFAPVAFREIKSAVAEEASAATCGSASCAATLARRLGASDMHAVMAAGFAGGIGLSGSGCGALGTAIWILGMRLREAGLPNKAITAGIDDLMERFLKSSGYQYECSEIVGRVFEDIDDHAAHLQQGGCEELIEAIAAAAEAVLEHALAPATGEDLAPAEESAAA